MSTKLVVKFMDGRIKKGFSDDFLFLRKTFHLREMSNSENEEEVHIADLKAVFFVGDYDGNPNFKEDNNTERSTYNHRVAIRFHDGEEIVGYTEDDLVQSDVLRLVPVDPLSNNALIFIVKQNAVSIQALED